MVAAIAGGGLWYVGVQEAATHHHAATNDQPSRQATAPAGRFARLSRPLTSTSPPLPQTDPIVRELVARLSSHPTIAAWLTTKGLVANFTMVTLSIAGTADAGAVTPPNCTSGDRSGPLVRVGSCLCGPSQRRAVQPTWGCYRRARPGRHRQVVSHPQATHHRGVPGTGISGWRFRSCARAGDWPSCCRHRRRDEKVALIPKVELYAGRRPEARVAVRSRRNSFWRLGRAMAGLFAASSREVAALLPSCSRRNYTSAAL